MTNLKDIPEDAVIIIFVNEEGVVVGARDIKVKGDDIEYGEEERTLIGAKLYTPRECCWRKRQGRWICRPEYCSEYRSK